MAIRGTWGRFLQNGNIISSRLRKTSDSGGSGEGHDFSRAVKSFRFARALAPEVCFLRPRLVFPQPPR